MEFVALPFAIIAFVLVLNLQNDVEKLKKQVNKKVNKD
jgi:hypothetical protein